LAHNPLPGWQKPWIPFLDDDHGNYRCVDPIAVRDCWDGVSEHKVVAPSLTAWVSTFLAALEKGEYSEDPERGTFVRS
jgi:hypothetical protein